MVLVSSPPMEKKVLQEFIEMYHSEPSLWKARSPYYNNRRVKHRAYCRLVEKLKESFPDADVDMVRKRINALRTNYRKERRRVEAGRQRNSLTGEPEYITSLWYFDLLHFISDEQENDEVGDTQEVAEYDVHCEYNGSDGFETEFRPQSPQPSDNKLLPASRTHTNNFFKRQRMIPRESEGEQHAQLWYDSAVAQGTAPLPQDLQDIFGGYVASKLRQMDKSQQMLSERLVSEVLFRGQMGLLDQKTSLSLSSNEE